MSEHDDLSFGCPFARLNRRRFLQGLGVASLGAAAAGLSGPAVASQQSGEAEVTDAPTSAVTEQSHPFHGAHQQGITTPRPAVGMLVAFDVLAPDRAGLERLLRTLTERIAFLTSGGTYEQRDQRFPPVDSGILGPTIAPDALTITLSVGESLFDGRFGLAAAKPRHLQRMTSFSNDALDAARCHGDLSLQFCANTEGTTIHALRDIIKNTPGLLMVRWKQEGTVPVMAPHADGSTESARNYLGFRDGTANPQADNRKLMQRVVWVDDANGEPRWAEGGSYQAVRIIRNFVERWDRTPLQEQQAIFGRLRQSGAPLSGGVEHDEPQYSGDPKGEITPLDSHIRLANPRTAESQRNLILRRPFNYSNGVEANGQLDMGLLFIAYQTDLDAGFITVQKRLDGEPLEEYIKPVGGGYFFTLPGIEEGDFLGSSMLAAS
ncbi:iron uptake transporter deferrochelatase/peroxidase subunit [Pseudomonas neustonica]|uniref:iron uptake transporter deferrochelatase/peroxidase subunit n=1 Tax=Pseudomonas neustonica TaxID=2487346 RepID=UPI0030DD9D5B|tara:strand:+ start:2674 stop:3978 length:1305 start_codon:yes stop_codon:yes gene_type:complete